LLYIFGEAEAGGKMDVESSISYKAKLAEELIVPYIAQVE
jgi:hypothetical protein